MSSSTPYRIRDFRRVKNLRKVPVSFFRKNLASCIKKLTYSPLLVCVDEKPQAVMLSLDEGFRYLHSPLNEGGLFSIKKAKVKIPSVVSRRTRPDFHKMVVAKMHDEVYETNEPGDAAEANQPEPDLTPEPLPPFPGSEEQEEVSEEVPEQGLPTETVLEPLEDPHVEMIDFDPTEHSSADIEEAAAAIDVEPQFEAYQKPEGAGQPTRFPCQVALLKPGALCTNPAFHRIVVTAGSKIYPETNICQEHLDILDESGKVEIEHLGDPV